MAMLFPLPCPELPEFQSLLLKGPYHASAPIYLALSHATQDPNAKVLLFTPNRTALKEALLDINDEWLNHNGGQGGICAVTRRVEIFYPPTLAHLRLLMSMMHEWDGVLHHAKTTLDCAPSLVVLHEVSSYLNTQASEATVSAYLSVISSALSMIQSWPSESMKPSKLVVFDSNLTELKLPILRSLSFAERHEDTGQHRNTLTILLERYFEWQGEIQIDEEYGEHVSEISGDQDLPDEVVDLTPVKRSLTLRRRDREQKAENEDVVWRWSEVGSTHEDGTKHTVFRWREA
ncbi:hypothetical protein C8Q78DRAFT_1074156 [Trametes maxima]|nr:hypothetical protein C8Q78DRAFT_1074156 [Trametes maxima]